jgi:acylphosphatase
MTLSVSRAFNRTLRSPDRPFGPATGDAILSPMECRLFRIEGRVQGVWFRESTRRTAVPLGITGYARNLSDGSVEVLACGERAALDRLTEWLKQGPPMAQVTRVESRVTDSERPESFVTR